MKIIFQLCGSIAAYKACQAISRLVQDGHEVQTVSSLSALQFVGEATLEGLTGRPVAKDLFTPGQMMNHIHLARWADLFILCPATANKINQLAQGVAEDLIGNLFLAKEPFKPYLIFPAANPKMLSHPATQQALEKLKKWGVTVCPTQTGILACGEEGEGKLLDPEEILQEIRRAVSSLLSSPLPTEKLKIRTRKILVTAGGTIEPLDQVRTLSNRSTGKTGIYLAKFFAQLGHEVTLIISENNNVNRDNIFDSKIKSYFFTTFQDLKNLIKDQMTQQEFDLILHAAAVSDFSLKDFRDEEGNLLSSKQKLPSNKNLVMTLTPNPKILHDLRSWSKKKDIIIIAFKLTAGANLKERHECVSQLQKQCSPDYIISNDWLEMRGDLHAFSIYQDDQLIIQGKSKPELAEAIKNSIPIFKNEVYL